MSDQEQKLDALLNAYVDRRLDEQTRKKYAAWLASQPEAQVEIEQFEKLNMDLRMTFGDRLRVPVSDRLVRAVNSYPDPSLVKKVGAWCNAKKYFDMPHVAIYAVITFLSLSLSFFISLKFVGMVPHAPGFYAQIESLALDAHLIYAREKRHAVEVPASDKEHMMKWLSERLSAEIGPPELESVGYTFIGGRLLPSAGKHAALYMYGDAQDRRLTLYIRLNEGSHRYLAPQCKLDYPQGPICTWQGEKLLYFLIGPPDNTHLESIAQFTAKLMHK